MSRASAAAAATAAARHPLPPPRLSLPASYASASPRASSVPHFVIDLSAPASLRWSAVVACYRHAWAPMVHGMWAEYEAAARDTALEEMQHEEQEAREAAAQIKKKAKAHKKTGAATAPAAAAAPKLSKKDAAAARTTELKSRAKSYLDQQVAFADNLAIAILAGFRTEGLAGYAEEIEALSVLSGVSIRDLLLLNLSYEAHGGCTSVLLPLQPSGEMMLGRTLDWNQESMLRALTVELSFMREGTLLYRAATFAGFLGIFTAHVPHRFAIAVNFRCVEDEGEGAQEEHAEDDEEEEDGADDEEKGQAEDEQDEEGDADADADGDASMDAATGAPTSASVAARASPSGGLPDSPSDAPFSYPVGYLVRHTLETCLDYASATAKLSCAPLMSPAYFIVAGTAANQGTIITRDLHASVRPLQIDPTARRDGAENPSSSADAKSQSRAKKKQRGGGSAAAAADASASPSSSSSASAPAAAAAAAATPLGSLFQMARSFISGSSEASAEAASAASAPLTTGFPSDAQIRALPSAAPSASPWLIQANMDHWLRSKKLDHQQSLPRVALAHRSLLSLTMPDAATGAVDEETLWRVLAQNPIWDDETIYASVSIPARDRFVTILDNPHPPPPRKKGAAAKRKGGRK